MTTEETKEESTSAAEEKNGHSNGDKVEAENGHSNGHTIGDSTNGHSNGDSDNGHLPKLAQNSPNLPRIAQNYLFLFFHCSNKKM